MEMTQQLIDPDSPAAYGLPHPDFRPHQLETIRWIEQTCKDGGTAIAEKPTGLGKTGIATALATESNKHKAVCLVWTKALQQGNYGDSYGWDVLFGRGNYPCDHPENILDATAEDCLYGAEMYKCDESASCLYVLEKALARNSQHASLNYAYWLVAGHNWQESTAVDYLVMDEAHLLPEVVVGHAGATWNDKQRLEWNLTPFPFIGKPRPGENRQNAADKSMAWIHHSAGLMDRIVESLELQALRNPSVQVLGKLRKARRLLGKLDVVGTALASPEHWFIRSGKRAIRQYGKTGGGMVVRPLTARFHFNHYFKNIRRVLMSATIGDAKTFADELGIEDYHLRQVSNQYGPELRPIHILDVPPMSRQKKSEDWTAYKARMGKRTQAICSAIHQCPSDWSGIIHVNSKAQARDLAKDINYRSPAIGDRIWVTPGSDGTYVPTDQQLAAWEQRKLKQPNSIAISWAMWEGYNGLDEKIDIVAKIPFPYLGDEYERARMDYSHRFYMLRAAMQTSQGLGRTRRGRPQDYGDGTGFVAIADGSWKRIRKYLSHDVQEAIVE